MGEVMGFSLVYSGNFLAQVPGGHLQRTRVTMGINPEWFDWRLEPGESFQTPEAVIVFSKDGLNGMSNTFHKLYRTRLARGVWRDRTRPILINNWEATYFDFNEEKLVKIASKAKECGVELFVLDDGWFGARRSDYAGLGDWVPAHELLPNGIKGLSEKIEALGLKFGLWIEPEMVNPDSDLYRAHPEWILSVPERRASLSRHQWVLDFSRKDVVDHIHGMIAKILRESKISYIKWDMNRSITECYSKALPADRQGEVFHRYILGVYDLYERLTSEFPEILFESCAGGGARFDPGMLYYAPQAWTSDDTDAVERMKIQYGTSYCYPVSSMGSHVSAVPNHQVDRLTPLKTRADVAYFGTFGYELDLNKLSAEEQEEVKVYTQFMKDHRELIQHGTFYRLQSPFTCNEPAWMVVSPDKKEALVAYFRILSKVNEEFKRLRLAGLDPELCYSVDGKAKRHDRSPGIIELPVNICKDPHAKRQEREYQRQCVIPADRQEILHRITRLLHLRPDTVCRNIKVLFEAVSGHDFFIVSVLAGTVLKTVEEQPGRLKAPRVLLLQHDLVVFLPRLTDRKTPEVGKIDEQRGDVLAVHFAVIDVSHRQRIQLIRRVEFNGFRRLPRAAPEPDQQHRSQPCERGKPTHPHDGIPYPAAADKVPVWQGEAHRQPLVGGQRLIVNPVDRILLDFIGNALVIAVAGIAV